MKDVEKTLEQVVSRKNVKGVTRASINEIVVYVVTSKERFAKTHENTYKVRTLSVPTLKS